MNNRAERDTEQGPYQPINNRERVLPPSLGDQQVHRKPHHYEHWMIARLLRMVGSPPVRFQLWSGEAIEADEGQVEFTLQLTD